MPDINERLLAGYTVGDHTFKVHIDGYNLLPYLTGQEPKTPRPGFIYFSDDGDLMALRFDNWKVVFAQQRSPGTLAFGRAFVHTRIPWLYNLRTDPYERADITSTRIGTGTSTTPLSDHADPDDRAGVSCNV